MQQPFFKREQEIEIDSSIESDVSEESKKIQRRRIPNQKGRFYYLWQSFATATTITSWVVIPSVSTRTLIPNAAGIATTFPCLPSGYIICTTAG